MSDGRKGIIEAVLATFVNFQKGMWVKHLTDNIRTNFSSLLTMNNKVWQAARKYEYERFTQHMEVIKDINEKTYRYVFHASIDQWSNALVVHSRYVHSRYNIITSNTTKCLNAWIGAEQRSWTALQLLKHII